jgi:hypothetical protein
MTERLGVLSHPSYSKKAADLVGPFDPMLTSVFPSESGKQLTAMHDLVDQTPAKPSISGNSTMDASLMNKSELRTATLIDADFIVRGPLC